MSKQMLLCGSSHLVHVLNLCAGTDVRNQEKTKHVFEDEKTGTRIELRFDPELGPPTISDRDILIYVCALMKRACDQTNSLPNNFSFAASDLLAALHRKSDARAYEDLDAGLTRLQRIGVSIRINSGQFVDFDDFCLIQKINRQRNDATNHLERVTIVAGDWLSEVIAKATTSIPGKGE